MSGEVEGLVKSWSNVPAKVRGRSRVSAGVEGCRVSVVVGELAKSVCKSGSLVKNVCRTGWLVKCIFKTGQHGQECL